LLNLLLNLLVNLIQKLKAEQVRAQARLQKMRQKLGLNAHVFELKNLKRVNLLQKIYLFSLQQIL
jgi:hypothetical protein